MIGVKKKIKRGDFVDISHYKTNDLKIGYQGVKGSFSEEAMISFFGENNKSLNYEKFEDVFISLKNDEIDYGILPFENSCTGAITSVYDLISKYGFYIVGEECIKINQNLVGVKDATVDDIKEVYLLFPDNLLITVHFYPQFYLLCPCL